jgi:hypothetical protein
MNGVKAVRIDEESLIVDLMEGRTISVPLAWYPRLADAEPESLGPLRRQSGGSRDRDRRYAAIAMASMESGGSE